VLSEPQFAEAVRSALRDLDTPDRLQENPLLRSLYSVFAEAGLPTPRMLTEATVRGGPDAPAWGWANVVSGVVPLMEKLGVATRVEVDPPTLADRLLAEAAAAGAYFIGPPMTGAWAVPHGG
jgi:hypothetical protein